MPKLGRPSRMDDPEERERFAELYAAGLARKDIAAAMGVSELDTVTKWSRIPEVAQLISEKRQHRANRILRKVEAAIEKRLENEDNLRKMDLKDLLAIKRDFTPQKIEIGRAGDFDEAADLGAWAALDAGEAPLELEPGDVVEDSDVD